MAGMAGPEFADVSGGFGVSLMHGTKPIRHIQPSVLLDGSLIRDFIIQGISLSGGSSFQEESGISCGKNCLSQAIP